MSSPRMQLTEPRKVNSSLWKACAGKTVHVPVVNSRVYYFPHGHLEQSSSSNRIDISPNFISNPKILCRVVNIQFLAHSGSDEVFTKILLQPLTKNVDDVVDKDQGSELVSNDDVVVSHAKKLSWSDTNNGGGLTVPIACAVSLFPPLDLEAGIRVQHLSISDIHGRSWRFMHYYRGSPLRNMLTRGWTPFVNVKRLISDDTVVFMKDTSTSQLFVGIRRKPTPIKRISTREVMKAVESAKRGMQFEILYYPTIGSSIFVVEAEKVDAALNMNMAAGMRIQMAMETKDSSKLDSIEGIVSVSMCEGPWRSLEIKWDACKEAPQMTRVSKWEVEVCANQVGVVELPMTVMTKDALPMESWSSSWTVDTCSERIQGVEQINSSRQTISDTVNLELTLGLLPSKRVGKRKFPFFIFMSHQGKHIDNAEKPNRESIVELSDNPTFDLLSTIDTNLPSHLNESVESNCLEP